MYALPCGPPHSCGIERFLCGRYAFSYVAIYGKDFRTSAKMTMELFYEKGIDVLINDNLVGNVLMVGVFIGGVVTALVRPMQDALPV